jgi:DMSO/TMAO reductase YedYZ molybdopterin-dependent catalytic subunit
MRARLLSCSILFSAAVAFAQDLAVAPQTKPLPSGVADPLVALLATSGERVSIGDKALDFWWVKSLPLRSGSTETGWSAVDEGTLVGVVQLEASYHEMRGKPLRPGLYTLRYGLQPENGDHLGVSPYREFLLLSPAAVDTTAATLGHDGTIALSRQAIGLTHPAVWSLDPPVASGAPRRLIKNQAGQSGVVFQVPISRDGKDIGTMAFGLILVGEIQS